MVFPSLLICTFSLNIFKLNIIVFDMHVATLLRSPIITQERMALRRPELQLSQAVRAGDSIGFWEAEKTSNEVTGDQCI